MSFGYSRRAFVLASAAASVLGATAVAADATEAPTAAPAVRAGGAIPFTFDRAAFQARIEHPFPHRQLVAPASFSDATVAMSHLRNSRVAYADPNGFAAGPDAFHGAIVAYMGTSLLMLLDDAMWAAYGIGAIVGAELLPNDASARAVWSGFKRNPMDAEIAKTAGPGQSIFVCNNALTSWAQTFAKSETTAGAVPAPARVIAIHDELAAHFVPGTMLVPAGVAAVNALQEARFTLLP